MQAITSANSNVKLERKALFLPPSLYIEPPALEISLDDFELLSLDRLQMLRSIEMLKARFDEVELNRKIREVRISLFASFSQFNNQVLS